ncbi:hypothetical protein RFI_35809 [Reticulomyxa filosa]|uniref:Uncharacterized protein n=1 Tax=Reticulomyxa filosa TaxID=46433 RepID=X6LJS6_RETFI|nr:hypothetical protein RFI_35809 [Reticulomyxa filosa]|eukprot:ETO01631.1 hypothetical protein RFI_35809 [Reticulomyxa filosa]
MTPNALLIRFIVFLEIVAFISTLNCSNSSNDVIYALSGCLPLDKVTRSYLPNFQYVLHHPDIHLCIIDQIKIIQTQSNTFNDMGLMKDRLNFVYFNRNLILLSNVTKNF